MIGFYEEHGFKQIGKSMNEEGEECVAVPKTLRLSATSVSKKI